MEHAVFGQCSGQVCQGQTIDDKLSPAEVLARHVPLFFLTLSVSLALPVLAYQSPGRPAGFVNDFAGAFSVEQKAALEAKLSSLQRETGAEVSVATILALGDETVETYSVKLFEEWGIGKAKQDNGLLILLSPNDRQARIEVGYGLEPVVTDVASSAIMRDVLIPSFKTGDYFVGVNSAADIIAGLIKSDPETEKYVESASRAGRPDISFVLLFLLILAFQLVPVIIYSKSWWLGGVIGLLLGFFAFNSILAGGVLTIIGLTADYFLSKKFAGKRPPASRSGVWFGGMGGGRGFGGSGGFGGMGGGMSGGGGSSGRW